MNTNSFLKNAKKALDHKKYVFFWFRHYKVIFFICFLIVLGYGSFSWHYYLNQYQWTEDEKKQFLDTNFKETAFKESKFKALVDRLSLRERLHTESPVLTKDIFGE